MPGRVICAAIVVSLALLAHAALAQDVTVEGNRFLRDGKPWVAEGVTLVGLVSPEGRVRDKPTYAAARAAFGPGMLGEVRRFGADTVRFQVSQTALDPRSKDHDPGYRDEVLDAVALARDEGFTVIVSMQWQGVSGRRGEGMPTGATRRAWAPIVRAFGDDRGVLLEIFNEPEIDPRTPKEWEAWRKPMQGLIDALRREGSENVLLVDGTQFARNLEGAPALDDPLGQLGYAVHPYLGRHNQTRAQWQKKWGDFARTRPVMATEWNASAGGNYCRPEMPAQAEALLDYLAEQRIGLVAWALDMPNLRELDGSYTTLDDLVCGEYRDGGRGGAGQMIHEHFLAH
jgi:endoglucanase